MTRVLLDAVSKRPGVTLWNNARVTRTDLSSSKLSVVTVNRDGEDTQACAPLIVSAEGRGSKTRERAGITSDKGEAFRMVGWKIPNGRLPHAEHGHLFLGAHSVTLAYPISKDEVRIMFELDIDQGVEIPDELLNVIPRPFRDDVIAAMKTQPRQVAKVFGLSPRKASSGNVVVVGDAGGCVHPITASGLAFCTGDALRLARALGGVSTLADVRGALKRYEKSRKGPMRTRVALGPALVQAFCAQDPAMKLLRDGLFRYWENSPRGRGVSMGLLSTQVTSLATMAREYATVCLYAIGEIPRRRLLTSDVVTGIIGLTRRSVGLLAQALR